MIRYCIMAFMFGYSGNKLFGKDKGFEKSIKVALVMLIILVIIDKIIK